MQNILGGLGLVQLIKISFVPNIWHLIVVFQKRCEILGYQWILSMSSRMGFRGTYTYVDY